MYFVDRYELDAKDVRKTADGYVVATPRVARIGIQLYAGKEVGKPDMPVVRVYRPEDQVMSKDSWKSFAFKPVTDDHPAVPVNAKNWKDHAVGLLGGEVARDGEFIRIPMTLMDEKVIGKYEAGKAELSVGYTCDLDFTPGITPDGKQYDATQKDIRANHVALVKDARGGRKLRIGDEKSPLLLADGEMSSLVDWYVADEKPVTDATDAHDTNEGVPVMKIVTVDGVSVQVADDTAATVIQRALDRAAQELADIKKSLGDQLAKVTADAAKTEEEKEKEKEEWKEKFKKKDAECVALTTKLADAEAKVKPENLDKMVADRVECVGKAKVIMGDKAPKDIEKMDTAAIQKAVVDHRLGDKAKDYDAGQIAIAFDTLSADVKAPGTGVTDMARQFSMPTIQDSAQRQAAYDKRVSDAWKNPAARA